MHRFVWRRIVVVAAAATASATNGSSSVMTTGRQPPVGRDRVLGDEHRVEAGGFGRSRELGDRVDRAQLVEAVEVVCRELDRDPHALGSPGGPMASATCSSVVAVPGRSRPRLAASSSVTRRSLAARSTSGWRSPE